MAAGNHTGDETERLFRNLQAEFQKVKQALHISGAETDGPPTLNQSAELFTAYESYYTLYYPHGGSAAPSIVLTEHGIQQ